MSGGILARYFERDKPEPPEDEPAEDTVAVAFVSGREIRWLYPEDLETKH
jgi:hypothetical protein